MRVLVACEFSGIVRDAFIARGHDAWSCDLLPTERPGPHIQGDVLDVIYPGRHGSLYRSFDLMVAHPVCTFMCNSGVRWFYDRDGNPVTDRFERAEESYGFFNMLFRAPIERIAAENPIPHKFARRAIGCYTQIIQPWQFGHGETKATCLWLKNLPKLVPTNIVSGRSPRVHHASPGPDRWKERSRTLQGIADAMAEQWGDYVTAQLQRAA